MSEIIPVLLRINPWDAEKGSSIYYTYTGYRQSLSSNLVVTDEDSDLVVYDFEFTSFEKVHHFPPDQLVNGRSYSAKIRVKFDDGSYSSFSNKSKFRTFKTPVLDISSIDGQGYVYNRDVTFVASYSQEDGETIKNYRFSLYDESDDLIKRFPVREPSNLNEVSETVEGLIKGQAYFVQCRIETVNGITYDHKERFIPMYIVPSVNGVISTRNDEENGFVRVTANLKKITGTQVRACMEDCVLDEYEDGIVNDNDDYDSDNYEYIDNEWIVVPSDKNLIFRGLEMNRASDFVVKVWCRDVPSNTKFMEISPEWDTGIEIEFWKWKDRVVVKKKHGKVESMYTSNRITIPEKSDFMVYARKIEHRMDLSVKLL